MRECRFQRGALPAPQFSALRDTPWWRRKLARIPNAWYLNVLLVSAGGTVARHVDATLRKPSGVDDALPELVSVLYLTIPTGKGGELQLWDGPSPVGRIAPKENALVHFRGDLAHAVRAFEGPEGALRASCRNFSSSPARGSRPTSSTTRSAPRRPSKSSARRRCARRGACGTRRGERDRPRPHRSCCRQGRSRTGRRCP